jgi:uncharacterized membrane protein
MTALGFIIGVVFVFATLLVYETSTDSSQPRLRQFGLFSWLVAGNWPAKVGAGLLIIGFGALIRYLLLNVDAPPETKLGAGVGISALLGIAAFLFRQNPKRRAMYLALAGAAHGVAYLTAYSAYGFFGFVNDVTGLALLVLVACASALFAVSANAASIAVLAMAGAFAAPAFAIGTPGPLVVYSYYLAASFLTLLLVLARGWRPLIHLNFLFTLAGGLFFGWTQGFYRPEHYTIMQPLLLALVAVHLLMPLAERRATRGKWLTHFDTAYFVALPIVATILTLAIAPSAREQGALGLAALGAMWALAAMWLKWRNREEAAPHALVSTLLFAAAALLLIRDVPWSLVGLVATAGILTLAPRLGLSRTVMALFTGVMLVFAAGHVVGSIFAGSIGQPFLNHLFIERIVAVTALSWASFVANRRDLSLAKVLGIVAVAWAGLSLTAELNRLHFEYLPQLVHGVLICFALGISVLYMARTLPAGLMGALPLLILGSAWWAATDAPLFLAYMLAILAPISLALLGRGGANRVDDADWPGVLALGVLPLAVLPWANRLDTLLAVDSHFFVGLLTVAAALGCVIFGQTLNWRTRAWKNSALPILSWVLVIALGSPLLFYIERSFWAIGFELLSLTTLFIITRSRIQDSRDTILGIATIALAAFTLQAMLLRIFGPAGVLNITDLAKMHMPAVISLLWATLGGGLCWWSTRATSRALWSFGAALLALSAVKLVLFDFGSLGQLGNIVALIAAGGVFLAVAWLAPIPPKVRGNDDADADQYAFIQKPPMAAHPQPSVSAQAHLHADAQPAQHTIDRPIPRAWNAPEQVTSSTRSTLISLAVAICIVLVGVTFLIFQRAHAPLPPLPPALLQLGVAPEEKMTAPPMPSRTENTVTQAIEAAMPPKVIDACSQFIARLPNDAVLYAGGDYSGRKLGFQIDQSSHEATRFDVVVNEPGRDIVLALGAYEPSVWNIRWTPQTRIVGVYVSGYHRQAIAGLDPDIPVLNSSYDNRGTCGYFYMARDNAAKADIQVQRIFGRPAMAYYIASNGQLEIGRPLNGASTTQSNRLTVKSFRDHESPLTGEAGLEQLMREGKLRPARRDDMLAWEEMRRLTSGQPPLNIVDRQPPHEAGRILRNTYVVLSPMRFPAGLYGAHSATFIVPRGIPLPEGDPGHSRVLDINSARCVGVACRQ